MTLNNTQSANWFHRFFAVVLLLMATLGAFAKPAAVVFYGDSLTAAYQLDPDQGYPALLQQKVEADNLQADYEVVASAVSGETSAGGQARIKWALTGLKRKKQDVAVFVLALGSNDGLRGLPVANMQENLQAILDTVKARYPDAQVVVARMFMPPNLGEAYREEFANAYVSLAEANDAILIPYLLDGVAGDPKLNLPDGMHPNAKGQQIIADNLWPIIKPLLTTDSPQS
ncbi:arylesterase [Cerasicoccus maritimus]|uniref:arylesterase n=1 Tax=Cerasicoccus maritimus TaxID=490089 RepID=UPI00285293C9|nr:arylesterase [Cerasicoccus maritimus]